MKNLNKFLLKNIAIASAILCTFQASAFSFGQVKQILFDNAFSYDFSYDSDGKTYYFYDLNTHKYVSYAKKITFPNSYNELTSFSYMGEHKKVPLMTDPISRQNITIYPGKDKINVIETILLGSVEDDMSFNFFVDKKGSTFKNEENEKYSWKGKNLSKVEVEDEIITFNYTPWDYVLNDKTPDWVSLIVHTYIGEYNFNRFWYAGCTFHPFAQLPSEITFLEKDKKTTFGFEYSFQDLSNNKLYIVITKTENGITKNRFNITVSF